MTQPNMGDYRSLVDSQYFDTLSNTHPIKRAWERQKNDPRNEEDYDTFDYGTEPLPGDRMWVRNARAHENMAPPSVWKNTYQYK